MKKLTIAISSFFIFTFSLVPLTALAAVDCNNPKTTQEAIQCGADNAAKVDQQSANNPEDKIDTTIDNIVDLLSVFVGIAAVIMLIYGGFRYITSGGNQESTKAAKSTILYALIGLIIVVLAQVIVKFVLDKATNP